MMSELPDGKKSPYDYDAIHDDDKAAAAPSGRGIFHVRPHPAPSATAADTLADRMDKLGVSTDSTDRESTVDLPTISVSEDELHDTLSDISGDECGELQDLDAADESTIGVSASMSGSCEELRGKPVVIKKVNSNPSIATRTTIKSRVKDFGGKVKGMFAGMHRSRDNVSKVSKIIASAGPGNHPDTVTIELKQLEEIRRKEMELKAREVELKKLESAKKKEEETRRKEEEKKRSEDDRLRKLEEKRIRMEVDKISVKEQELKRKEHENEEKLAKKEQEVIKKEREVTAREALLEKRQLDIDRRFKELEQQTREEKAKIEQEKDLIRRERISLSGDRMSREASLATIRPSKSENEINGADEPLKPPRKKYESRENLADWTESRRKLPPPPRPPLPIPKRLPSRVSSPDHQSSKSPRLPARFPQQQANPDISIQSATMSSSLTTTQMMHTAPTSPATLFRISPTSSSSTLFCSDFMDIPLDDDATLRGSLQRDRFDAKSFYKMIVLQWRKRHPRRVLKDSRQKGANNRAIESGSNFRYANISSTTYQNTRIYSRPITPIDPPPRGHYNEPTDVIYAVPHKHPAPQDQLRCYNYRVRRKKEFFYPYADEENPYDEIIYPIPGGSDIYPLAPPRVKRGRSNIALDGISRESSTTRTETSIPESTTETAES